MTNFTFYPNGPSISTLHCVCTKCSGHNVQCEQDFSKYETYTPSLNSACSKSFTAKLVNSVRDWKNNNINQKINQCKFKNGNQTSQIQQLSMHVHTQFQNWIWQLMVKFTKTGWQWKIGPAPMRLLGCAYQTPWDVRRWCIGCSEPSKHGGVHFCKRLNEKGIFLGVINDSIFCAGTRWMTNQRDYWQ